MAQRSYSIVVNYGKKERGMCGYCKNPNMSKSGMQAIIMEVQDYQALIDRGWRRSASYCYKPCMNQTCCPSYTIKCEALNFKLTKSQKKILKRMGKFLRNELQKDDLMNTGEEERDDIEIGHFPRSCKHPEDGAPEVKVNAIDDKIIARLQPIGTEKRAVSDPGTQQKQQPESIPRAAKRMETSQAASRSLESVEMNPIGGSCKKAKLLRIERKQQKLLAQGKTQAEIDAMFKKDKRQNQGKSLEELFDEILSETNRLELKLVRTTPMSSEYLETAEESFEVFKKYQTTIHRVPEQKVTERRYMRFLVNSPLQIKSVRVNSDEFLESIDASADLHQKYQMAIHGESAEECNKEAFLYFFVQHPLKPWIPENGPPCGYGVFHEQYWLDNKLIAVGVIDILPLCVSSVYFFYDPAYSFLSLGTFSSLREVYLTRQLNKSAKDLQYYYMGFYIHSCPKMRYKARMKPSKLLCPETYEWFDIDPSIKKLDKEKYCRFNDNLNAIDQDAIVDADKVLVLYRQIAMPFKFYKERVQQSITKQEEEKKEVEEYARLVGMKCAQRMLLHRP